MIASSIARIVIVLIVTVIVTDLPAAAPAASTAPAEKVPVVDGIVQPRRPIHQAITEAMAVLRKADGKYVPGRIDGPLAGYFISCYVNADGTPANRCWKGNGACIPRFSVAEL